MGTPDFAVATLGSLLMNGYNVAGVVTSPDRPAGRGRKLNKSAVKEFAEESNLLIMQPDNLKDPEFVGRLKSLSPDIFIVVAFRMLPEVIWKMPKLGTFNLHASLLPRVSSACSRWPSQLCPRRHLPCPLPSRVSGFLRPRTSRDGRPPLLVNR